jgi:hypothetical protein
MVVWLEMFGYSIPNKMTYCGTNKVYLFLSLLVCIYIYIYIYIYMQLSLIFKELKQPKIDRYYFLKQC